MAYSEAPDYYSDKKNPYKLFFHCCLLASTQVATRLMDCRSRLEFSSVLCICICLLPSVGIPLSH